MKFAIPNVRRAIIFSIAVLMLICNNFLLSGQVITESEIVIEDNDNKEEINTADPFEQGLFAGRRDGKGSPVWFAAGFFGGQFGVAGAAIYTPKPDVLVLYKISNDKGTDYAIAYEHAYTKKSRKKNITYASIGFASNLLVYFVLIAPNL